MPENPNVDHQNRYKYCVSGERGGYTVKFHIQEPNKVEITCTCGRSNGGDYACRHARYVLSSKISKITSGDTDRLKELIERVKTIDKDKVKKAERQYRDDAHCRRCNSNKIVKIKESPLAQLRLIFKEHNHTFFCKACKWTW